jgi:hypothetical protein
MATIQVKATQTDKRSAAAEAKTRPWICPRDERIGLGHSADLNVTFT